MNTITKPTLLLDKARALRNIDRMIGKARASGARFRPHMKTHQSAVIAGWFRQRGVAAITVSSFDMARYFADHGWRDIMVAFSVNLLEMDALNRLAADIRLHVLVESPEVVRFLEQHLQPGCSVSVWIKIDTGYHRTGIPWDQVGQVLEVARRIADAENLGFCGLLTHAGHTYRACSNAEIAALYADFTGKLQQVRRHLTAAGFQDVEISIGDTPSCSVVEDLSAADEIRPGNFVFYDVMQFMTGACHEDDIALAVACPVVAKHEERREVVVYGGAVHLSKESLAVPGDHGKPETIYGYLAAPLVHQGQKLDVSGWGRRLEQAVVTRLSQEHGIVRASEAFLRQVQVGDVLLVLPVHSCLVVNLLREYLTLEGDIINVGNLHERAGTPSGRSHIS